MSVPQIPTEMIEAIARKILLEYAWELGKQDIDAGLCYLENFASDIAFLEFEEKVCCQKPNVCGSNRPSVFVIETISGLW